MIPRSHGGGEGKNIKIVEERSHNLFHKSFDNKPPSNIVRSIDAMIELFGDIKLSELRTLIELEWTPK